MTARVMAGGMAAGTEAGSDGRAGDGRVAVQDDRARVPVGVGEQRPLVPVRVHQTEGTGARRERVPAGSDLTMAGAFMIAVGMITRWRQGAESVGGDGSWRQMMRRCLSRTLGHQKPYYN